MSRIWCRVHAYVLEVSSPGLDRKLIKPADYERFAGTARAKYGLNEPVENQKYLEARLAGYSDGVVKLTVKDREDRRAVQRDSKANLVVEL